MEEKESTVFGFTGNLNSVSPPQPVTSSLPQVLNMAVDMNVENSAGAGATIAAAAATTAMATPGSTGAAGGGQGSFDLFGKKKRGRPRKYDSVGNLRSTHNLQGAAQPPSPGFSLSPTSEYSSKRGRGRPPGSGNWQLLASLGELFAHTAGGDFTPHVVTVHTGEDVAGKILSFAQKGHRGICVLSANGAISDVTIRQPGSSGGTLTYEGRFEILSLSGSFTVSENGGMKSRTGGLSVSLAGPDGRVIGGGVAGLLTAASPIQIVVGSFVPNGYKTHKRKHHREHPVASPPPGPPNAVTAGNPISQANPDGENCMTPMSQLLEHSQRDYDDVKSEKHNLDVTHNAADWNGSEDFSDQRSYPDINISLPGE